MRRSGSKLCLIAMITATATLTACAPKGSVEQHTRHYVYASDDGSGSKFSTQKAEHNANGGAFLPAAAVDSGQRGQADSGKSRE